MVRKKNRLGLTKKSNRTIKRVEADVQVLPQDDEEYEVEKVLAVRLTDEGKSYLVKWVDFSEEESTWELEEQLANSRELLTQFHRDIDQKEKEEIKKGSGGHYVYWIVGIIVSLVLARIFVY